MVTSRYYKRRWDEVRGDEHDDWGPSTWYFEVGEDGYAVRQIEDYDHGPTLCYAEGEEDEFGFPTYARFEEGDDWSAWEIDAAEFEAAWSQGRSQ